MAPKRQSRGGENAALISPEREAELLDKMADDIQKAEEALFTSPPLTRARVEVSAKRQSTWRDGYANFDNLTSPEWLARNEWSETKAERTGETQRQRYARQAERRAEYKRKSDAMRIRLLDAAKAAGVPEPDEPTMKAAVWALIIGPSFIEHGKVLKLRKSAREFLSAIAQALIDEPKPTNRSTAR